MDEIKSATARRRRASQSLAVESLEGRRLMTASITQAGVKEVAMKGFTELDVSGSGKGDAITILDNGSNTAGNVIVQFANGTTYTTKAGVAVVKVQGGAGNDHVTFDLTGPLTSAQSVLINLGNGSNSFVGNIDGAIDAAGGFDLEVYGGTGNDSMIVNQTGPTLLGAFVPYLSGGGGRNLLSYHGTGMIAANSSVSPEFAGGSGTDTITSNYSGQVVGNYMYNLSVNAGSGTEIITNDVFLAAGSTGTVGMSPTQQAAIKAGKGNDTIHFRVASDPSSTAAVNAVVVGAGGHGTIASTSNIAVDGNVARMKQTSIT